MGALGLSRVTDSDLNRLFGEGLADSTRASLRDALVEIGAPLPVSVIGTAPLAEPDAVVVELLATLAGGGEARFAVACRRDAERSWRVIWLRGPGVEWPNPRQLPEAGLTTSPPP